MSQTVAGTLVDVLEKFASSTYSASLATCLIRSPTLSATAKSNGSASAMRKGQRSRPRAKQSSLGGSAFVVERPGPASPTALLALMKQVAITRRLSRSPG